MDSQIAPLRELFRHPSFLSASLKKYRFRFQFGLQNYRTGIVPSLILICPVFITHLCPIFFTNKRLLKGFLNFQNYFCGDWLTHIFWNSVFFSEPLFYSIQSISVGPLSILLALFKVTMSVTFPVILSFEAHAVGVFIKPLRCTKIAKEDIIKC